MAVIKGKLSSDKIIDLVDREILKKQRQERVRRQLRLKRAHKHIIRFIPLPLTIGLVASIILYLHYGWAALEQTLLSWIIGITLIATVLTSIYEKYREL